MRVSHAAPVILLVQPHDDNAQMYAEYLRAHRVTCIVATTVPNALAVAPSADVVVTGLQLSGEHNGFELIRQLRANNTTKEIPIIVLTAWAFEPARERAQAAGAERF